MGDLYVRITVVSDVHPVTHLEHDSNGKPPERLFPGLWGLDDRSNALTSLLGLGRLPLANVGVAQFCLQEFAVHPPELPVGHKSQSAAPSHAGICQNIFGLLWVFWWHPRPLTLPAG